MLVGNKSDIIDTNPTKRAVSETEIRELASELSLIHMQTSAKTGKNVDRSFKTLINGTNTHLIAAIYESKEEMGNGSRAGANLRDSMSFRIAEK